MRTSSKNSSDVSCAFIPSFSRLRPRVNPGRFDSTRKSVTPLAPAAESVFVASTMTSQSWPLEMKTFWPLITYSSPSRRACVRMALRSLPGVRLGHAERTDRLAPDHFRQPVALLLFGAERQDVGRDEIGMDEEARPARADPPKLLEHDDIEQIVEAEAAIFFRHGAAEQALLAGLQPELARNDALLLPLRVVGDDLLLDEAADRWPARSRALR